MDWHEKMNAAMDYIEDNLTENIDLLEAARLALGVSFSQDVFLCSGSSCFGIHSPKTIDFSGI